MTTPRKRRRLLDERWKRITKRYNWRDPNMPVLALAEEIDFFGRYTGKVTLEEVSPEDWRQIAEQDFIAAEGDFPSWRDDPSYFWSSDARRSSGT